MYLKYLGYAELKVLLVVIRQTYGWKDKQTGSYKRWDWISQQFFVRKTGLSARAVSTAISKLIYKRIINVKDEQGRVLYHKIERQRASKLYFSCILSNTSELTSKKPVKKLHTTIIKHTSRYREDSSQGFQKIQFHKHIKP